MSRQKYEKTFNTFTKGLMTEASELNFPEDFSLYEKNFLLHRDGGRDRRKGMELMYPLGMTLTSTLYPIEFDDSLAPSVTDLESRTMGLMYAEPESTSTFVSELQVELRSIVRDYWLPEGEVGVSVGDLQIELRKSLVQYDSLEDSTESSVSNLSVFMNTVVQRTDSAPDQISVTVSDLNVTME